MPWLYKQRGSRFWWLGYRTNGGEVRRSTGQLDRADADKLLAQVETMLSAQKADRLTDELYRGITGRALPNITLAASLRDWVAEASRTTAPKTAERYRRVGESLSTFIGASDKVPLLRDITPQQIRAFLVDRLAHVSTSSANLDRKILSVFFLRAMRQSEITVNPVLSIKQFKVPQAERRARRAFTLVELQLMYGKAPDDFWRYMILAGFYCGQRMGDLISLVRGSVDFGENLIRLTQGKTGKTVTVPMAAPLRQLLQGVLSKKKGNPGDFVWHKQATKYAAQGAGPFSLEFYDDVLTPCGLVTKRATKAKAKKGRDKKRDASAVSFHSLRHTFVTVLRATGGNQAVAKALAGHSSDSVNDLYTHLPVESMIHAIEQMPLLVFPTPTQENK
ncbi:MAG: hypothetical protein QOF48_1744 [Verrucomicrobiota bacterium]|jgi:integrase